MNKLLIVCGPTATGKTALGIALAKKFGGEIISADSRQVYRGLDLGTGKDLPEYVAAGVKVWGLDLVDPDEPFSVADFVRFAQNTINEIWSRRNLPIIVGGTGLYISGLLKPPETIYIPPNAKLRLKIEKYSLSKLQNYLKKSDADKWEKMNQSDQINPRRLIRAIEIGEFFQGQGKVSGPAKIKYDTLKIGLTAPREIIYQRINKRLENLVKLGMEKEVSELLRRGVSGSSQSMSGTGYKIFAQKLKSSPSGLSSKDLEQATKLWQFADHAYARRQITWFKKENDINWFDVSAKSWESKVVRLVKAWYN